MSQEDAPDPWAEEALDSSFLGSGEELDLLSEILDSLSTQATRTRSLRPSQSLDCCHTGGLDSCSSLPNIPGGPTWQADDVEEAPEPQALSLPASLPCLQALQPLDAALTPKNLTSWLPSEASQEVVSPSSIASADPSSQRDPNLTLPEPQPLVLHLSPQHKLAEDPRAQESPCSLLSTTPSHPETPQLLAPTEPSLDTNWKTLDSSSSSGSLENPKARSSEALLAKNAHFQSLEEWGAPEAPAVPTSTWQEPQARSRPRVAELKKCFEG